VYTASTGVAQNRFQEHNRDNPVSTYSVYMNSAAPVKNFRGRPWLEACNRISNTKSTETAKFCIL